MVAASRVSAREATEERPVVEVKETVSKEEAKAMVDREKERASKVSGGRVRTTTTATAKVVEKDQRERKGSKVIQEERAARQDRCVSLGTGTPMGVRHHVQMDESTSASTVARRITKARTAPDRGTVPRQRVMRPH